MYYFDKHSIVQKLFITSSVFILNNLSEGSLVSWESSLKEDKWWNFVIEEK